MEEEEPEGEGGEVETSLTVEADGRKATVTLTGPAWAVEAVAAAAGGDTTALDAVQEE